MAILLYSYPRAHGYGFTLIIESHHLSAHTLKVYIQCHGYGLIDTVFIALLFDLLVHVYYIQVFQYKKHYYDIVMFSYI